MTKLEVAATLLEIESLCANARANALKMKQEPFLLRLMEARTLLNTFMADLLANQASALTEYFLAVPSDTPETADAVRKDTD